jgi:hypothetical protein
MRYGNQQLMQYLDLEKPILVENFGINCDFLGLVSLFKDHEAIVRRLQDVATGRDAISVGLFRNPLNPLDPSGTPTFREVVGSIFWELIWKPRFSGRNLPEQQQRLIQDRLHRDIEEIFFPMFDADQSSSIDIMELLMGLIRMFRAFRSYDGHIDSSSGHLDPIVFVKRHCLSPLFSNLCKMPLLVAAEPTLPDIPAIFSWMFSRMHAWDTLKSFLQSLFNDFLWQEIKGFSLFQMTTIQSLELCCANFEPSQRSAYDQHCGDTIIRVSREIFQKLRPLMSPSSKLAFFVDEVHAQKFFGVKRGTPAAMNDEIDVIFLFLWKFMDHFLSCTTSLSFFFDEQYATPMIEDVSAIRIDDLISDLDKTRSVTHVQTEAVSLKRWYVSSTQDFCILLPVFL